MQKINLIVNFLKVTSLVIIISLCLIKYVFPKEVNDIYGKKVNDIICNVKDSEEYANYFDEKYKELKGTFSFFVGVLPKSNIEMKNLYENIDLKLMRKKGNSIYYITRDLKHLVLYEIDFTKSLSKDKISCELFYNQSCEKLIIYLDKKFVCLSFSVDDFNYEYNQLP